MSKEFKDILQAKIDHYGETKFAYESACDEYIKSRTTHPSDSDIEKEAKEFTEQNHAKTDMKGAYTYSGYIAGSQRMRDRMNGEMELLIEWLDKETGKGDGMWLLNSEEDRAAISIKQLLQKFRSR